MTGYIHSMESMGLVDGPGVRAVVFLQGRLRCRYIVTTPTPSAGAAGRWRTARWSAGCCASAVTSTAPAGARTFSGGEPLAQPDFLLACLRRLKAEGVHTCLDTSGSRKGNLWGDPGPHRPGAL